MVLSQTLQTLIQKDEFNKANQLFVVSVAPGIDYKSLTAEERASNWERHFEKLTNPPKHATFKSTEDNKDVCTLNFSSGILMKDYGNRVEFYATQGKETAKSETNQSLMGIIANGLCRRGWKDGSMQVDTNRSGSAELMQHFEKSYKEASKMMDRELISNLAKSKMGRN